MEAEEQKRKHLLELQKEREENEALQAKIEQENKDAEEKVSAPDELFYFQQKIIPILIL
jgi:hypothetical protein